MAIPHEVHAAGGAGAQRGGCAGVVGVVGEELDVEAGLVGGLDQQRQVGAPVAGDHRVGAGGLDLGDIGREVRHLGERVQVLADNLDVGTLAREVGLGELGHLDAVRVVLADDVDLVDVLLILDEGGQRLHLHRGVGVEAEVPVAALAVGEIRVDRRVVHVEHFLARIALVVLVDRVDQRARGPRAVALRHVADVLVDGRLQAVERLGRAHLVVERHDLELHAGRVALVEELRDVLEALQLVLADGRHQPRQRIDPGDLHGLALLREGGTGLQRDAGQRERAGERQGVLRQLHGNVSVGAAKGRGRAFLVCGLR